jgi:hypothetical protein
MTLGFEMFATTGASSDALWAVVGDPARLPEWTDVEHVDGAGPVEEGGTFTTTVEGRDLTWTVLTAGDRIWEARTVVDSGALGLGARVVADARGSRLVLAGTLEPSGSRLRARLVTLPRLRSRCDRWSARALKLARSAP